MSLSTILHALVDAASFADERRGELHAAVDGLEQPAAAADAEQPAEPEGEQPETPAEAEVPEVPAESGDTRRM